MAMLAMIAITPAGWYDWESKGLLRDSRPMAELQPLLARAREAGIGLVGMKAGRYLAGRKFLGWGKPDAFDDHYDEAFLASGLSPFQRSYAYVLANGLDAVNADMQSFAHLEENLAIYDFVLGGEEMTEIDTLDRHRRFNDPEVNAFFKTELGLR